MAAARGWGWGKQGDAGQGVQLPTTGWVNSGDLVYSTATTVNCAVWGFPGGSEVKASAWNVGDPGSIPELGRSPGEGNGNPLQDSCLENPMEGGAW